MFITPAFAQEATQAATTAAATSPSFLMSIMPLILILFVFYIMVIRPQNKRMTEHRAMLNSLAKGDRVITGGGIVGKVVKLVGEDEVILEIASGVEVSVVRHTILTKKAA